jgi:hypothetical protein
LWRRRIYMAATAALTYNRSEMSAGGSCTTRRPAEIAGSPGPSSTPEGPEDALAKPQARDPYTHQRVRRNGIVHEGQSVTPAEAVESLKIAEELCSYVIGFAP